MNAWQNDPFFQYPLTAAKTSEGRIDLPIFYYDDSIFMTLFAADHAACRHLLEGQGLEAVRLPSGKAVVAVNFYQYRHCAIAPYNEVGVAIAVVPAGTPQPMLLPLALYQSLDQRQLGFHVIDLPVTTPQACAAGRELWGFPKFVAPIDWQSDSQGFQGVVHDPEGKREVVRLAGKPGLGMPAPQPDLVTYSRLGDTLLRTLINTRGPGMLCLPGTVQLAAGKSKHPMAQRLRALGLDQARPLAVFHSDRLQLRLNAGAPISADLA